MPSTYTTSLRLTLPATGELAGTWGTTVNAGVTSLAEAAIAGTAAVTMIDADYTLTAVNGSADQSRNMFVTLTGTLTAARNVICPPVSKLYFVTNNTTGGYAITFKTLAGTGVSVPNGQRAVVYCNGTDVLGGITALDSLSLNGSLTLVGGTANTVPYLNGSKVVTTGAALAFDGTNLSLGAAPSAWSASYKAYELPAGAVWSVSPTSLFLTSNAYNNGTNYIYKTSNAASQYQQGAGAHTWSVAASGTAGNTFTFTTAMTLNASGNLGVGTASPNARFTAGGNSSANTVADIQITRSSSGTTIQTGPNITFGDGTTNNTVALQATQGRFGVWNYGGGSWNERLSIDASGNVGLKVTPSAWSSVNYALQGTGGALFSTGANNILVGSNVYYDGAYKYVGAFNATLAAQSAGQHQWLTAAVGTAGAAISWTTAMTLDASGNLGIGKTPSLTQLHVKQSTTYAFGIDNSNETQNYSWRVDTGAGNPLILGTRTTSTDLLWLSAAGNLGLGVTPSAWISNTKAAQIGSFLSAWTGSNGSANISFAAYEGVAINTYRYLTTGDAPTMYSQLTGAHRWYTAPSGTAGNAITFTQAMTLDASSNLLVTGYGRFGGSLGYIGKSSDLVTGGAATDTALRYDGNNLVFAYSNTERMRLDSSGNLSLQTGKYVGNNSFGRFWLQPGQSIGTASFAGLYGAATTYNAKYDGGWKSIGGGTAGAITIDEGIFSFSSSQTVGAADVALTWTTRMVVDTSGNLGIGTSSPIAITGTTVDVAGASGASQRWRNNAGTSSAYLEVAAGVTNFGNAVSTPLAFVTAATEWMRLDASGNLGIGTTSPVNKLQVNGSFGRTAPVLKTADFTLAATENWIINNKAGSACVATLPAASSWTGREVTFKNVAAFSLDSASSNITQLPGGATQTSIAPAGRWATLVSDGTNWVVVASGTL